MVFRRDDLILNFDRIRSSATDFIRSNPITTAAIALGVPLTFVGIAAIGRAVGRRRRKKKAKTTGRRRTRVSRTRRRTTTKRVARRRKRVTHASPRHRGHKRVAFTTKDGRRVSFLVGKRKHKRR